MCVDQMSSGIEGETIFMLSAKKIPIYKLLHFITMVVSHFWNYKLLDGYKFSVLKFHDFTEIAIEVLYFTVIFILNWNKAHGSLTVVGKSLHILRKTLYFLFSFFRSIVEFGSLNEMKRGFLSYIQDHLIVVIRNLLHDFLSLLELLNYFHIKHFNVIIPNL